MSVEDVIESRNQEIENLQKKRIEVSEGIKKVEIFLNHVGYYDFTKAYGDIELLSKYQFTKTGNCKLYCVFVDKDEKRITRPAVECPWLIRKKIYEHLEDFVKSIPIN